MPGSSAEPPYSASALGDRIREHRQRHGRSQEELAALAGLSLRTVSNVELGRVARPRWDTVRLLASALELEGSDVAVLEAMRRGLDKAASDKTSGGSHSGTGTVPHQLPRDVADFMGREPEVAMLAGHCDASGTAAPVLAVVGAPGVGKTSLVVHCAHAALDRFPDGQVFVDLHGSEGPLDPVAVLARVLRELGVADADVPQDPDERTVLYRSTVADRRLLIVLDDAFDERQVRPLLPGASQCVVLITARRGMRGLELTGRVELGPLSEQHALGLIGRIAGAEQVRREPGAAAAVVAACAGLPLALRIAGARAAGPGQSLDRLSRLLVDEHRRLDALVAGDLEVRASVALSYRAMEPAEQRLLRLLGLLGAEPFPAWVAAALLDVPVAEADRLVDRLVDLHLLGLVGSDPLGQDRYRFADLIRLFARERAHADESPGQRQVAISRLVGCWLDLCERAVQNMPVTPDIVVHGAASRWTLPEETRAHLVRSPDGWLEAERPNLVATVLLAAESGLAAHAWELAGWITAFLYVHSYWDSVRQTAEAALVACRAAGVREGEAAALATLGRLAMLLERGDEADALLDTALTMFRHLGEARGEAWVLRVLSVLARVEGLHLDSAPRIADAARLAERSVDLARLAGAPELQADALVALGNALTSADRAAAAAKAFAQAITLYRQLGATGCLPQALWGLSRIRIKQGRHASAETALRRALRITTDTGDRLGSAYLTCNLADARLGQDDEEGAIGLLYLAAGELSELGERNLLADVHRRLSELCRRRGDLAEAERQLSSAITVWQANDEVPKHVRGLLDLAEIRITVSGMTIAAATLSEADVLLQRHAHRLEPTLYSDLAAEIKLKRDHLAVDLGPPVPALE